jgi:flagellar protein FliS
MSYTEAQGRLKQYNKVATETGIDQASPHRLIQLLLDGALDKIASSKGYMERGNYYLKNQHISWASSIINGLRISLDEEMGGNLAANLDNLYEYMCRCLMEANVKNDPVLLDEVAGLLREIKSAWDAIPQNAQRISSQDSNNASLAAASARK